MELCFKLYKENNLLLNKTIDGDEFNRTYIKISDKYLNIKQDPKYYENSREGLKLRLNRKITEQEKKALNGLNLEKFDLELINYLEATKIELKDSNILSFFRSMHNEYYDTLEEIYEFYEENEDIICKADLLIITKLN